MKFLFLWIGFVVWYVNCPAKDILQIKQLGKDGITLNKLWKFQSGDNPQWALPDFNDNSWGSIDPTQDILDLAELKPGVTGWFRLNFTNDTSNGNQLGMIIQCSGASEFYLDGKLIDQFGVVSADPLMIKAWDPLFTPVPLILSDRTSHVLAVRYVLQPGIHYTKMFETKNPAIQLRLIRLQDSIHIFSFFESSWVGFLLYIIGTCFLLAILHFAFYLFYPPQKANLSLAIYAVGFLLFNVIQFKFFLHSNQVSSKFYLGNIAMDLRVACNFFLLSALYNLLDRPRDKPFWGLIAFSIISVFLNIWPYEYGWKMGGALVEIFIGAGVMRIAYQATIKRKRGARIILAGTIAYFVSFSVFFISVLLPNDSFLLNLDLPRIVLYTISFLSIPVATSIFLGLDFAFTNRALTQKLKEVEELSEKNIQQEKEKQEILETQNETLETQVKERTNELTHSLQELKSTQSQLIQKEKMASLGELTAGIAHEIQNPLNFVNNFSEVNKELLVEMKDEMDKGNINDAKAIANDVIDNEQKINHHGKRADAIVKGMLQHSRSSTGQKEPTNINTLADEYLRLSYHNICAKDKSFNATLIPTVPAGRQVAIGTDFDESIGNINIIPQDIGRVILNLITNAFYAVNEKKKQAGDAYEPTVFVSTKKVGETVEIKVSDNGTGVPQKIVDKIFQPFFTTKPTGQGTGLGLSLAYDIVKAHGGEIKVMSKEGDGVVFIVELPIQNRE